MSLPIRGRPTTVRPGRTHAIVVLTRGGVEVARWPLIPIDRPDLGTADALARLQLAAKRLGCAVRLRDASAELTELLDLVGLRELCGQTESGEEVGVEEVVVPDDPVA